jgi:hypothetical protein
MNVATTASEEMSVEGGGAILFGLMTALFALLFLYAGRRLLRSVLALRAGGRAEGTCIDVYSSQAARRGQYQTSQCTITFTSLDGRTVRFKEFTNRLDQGQRVTVSYDTRRPSRATIAGPGMWSPLGTQVVLLLGGALGTLLGLLALVIFGLG